MALVAAVVMWAMAAPGLLAGVRVAPAFWALLPVCVALGAASTLLYYSALSRSDLSLVAPLGTTTVLWAALFAAVLLGQVPRPVVLVGALAIVLGGYVLGTSTSGAPGSVLAPLLALARDRGARLMLAACLLSGLNALVDRLGVHASSAPLWAASVITGWLLIFLPRLHHRGRMGALTQLPWRWVALVGGVAATGSVAYAWSVAHLDVAVAVALKQTSILLSVLLGSALLGEGRLVLRLSGATLVALGAALVAAFSTLG
jgi:drug/metabolite transporter (DMT)-like permease